MTPKFQRGNSGAGCLHQAFGVGAGLDCKLRYLRFLLWREMNFHPDALLISGACYEDGAGDICMMIAEPSEDT